MSDLPARSRVVVVGGGVVGCSVAYHLATLGCADVLLLERHQYGSGTTWHAAGNLETFRADPLLGELVAYGMSLYPRLEAESEQSIGWRTCGRVMYTADPARRDDFRGLPRLGALRGVEIEPLAPDEVVKRLPISSADGVIAGAWVPGDGRLNPVDLVTAYSRAARRLGVTTLQRTEVHQILTREGRVIGVRTDQGDVECESVVLAAGMWSPDLAATCAVSVPLHGVEHMYVVTQPLDEVTDDLPMFLSYDERLYGREEGGGLLVGFFDENAVPLAPDRLPPDFEFSLMPPNWDQITANLEIATHRFPVLADAEIRIQYNGPESFTPDVKMLLGETAEVAGLFVSAGLNSSGIALAAGAGRLTAEWVLDGYPSLDASRLDIQRFAPEQGGLTYRRARASEAVTFMCRRPGPGVGFESARDQRLSPLHELLVAAGAHMGPAQTWERPLWFGDRDSAAESVTAEVHAARTGVAITDRSSDAKLRVTGDDVHGQFDWGSGSFSVGTARLVVLTAPGRTSKAMPWVARLGVDDWLFMVEADQATRLKVWLHHHLPSATVSDESLSWGAVCLRGPRSQQLLDRVIDAEIPAGGAVPVARERGVTGWVIHVDPGPCFVTLTPATDTAAWYIGLLAAGADLDARPAGYWADEEAWVSAGIPRFGRESSPSSATKLAVSPGRETAPDDGERPLNGEMTTFRADGVDFVAAEGAPLVSDGVTVGYVTTAVPDGTTGASLLRGVVSGVVRSSQQPVYAVVDGRDHLLQPLEPLEVATG